MCGTLRFWAFRTCAMWPLDLDGDSHERKMCHTGHQASPQNKKAYEYRYTLLKLPAIPLRQVMLSLAHSGHRHPQARVVDTPHQLPGSD